MCGIVGYMGKGKGWGILVEGVKGVEYGGYDSGGGGLMRESDELNVYKCVGKVGDLEGRGEGEDVWGCVGMGDRGWGRDGERGRGCGYCGDCGG